MRDPAIILSAAGNRTSRVKSARNHMPERAMDMSFARVYGCSVKRQISFEIECTLGLDHPRAHETETAGPH